MNDFFISLIRNRFFQKKVGKFIKEQYWEIQFRFEFQFFFRCYIVVVFGFCFILQFQKGSVVVSRSRKQFQEFKILIEGSSRCVYLILFGYRIFLDVYRKMICVKFLIIWIKFRIVFQGDFFLSIQEYTYFLSILLECYVFFFIKVFRVGRALVQVEQLVEWFRG